MKEKWIVIVEEYGLFSIIQEELTEEDWYEDDDAYSHLWKKHEGLMQMGANIMVIPVKDFLEISAEVGPLKV